MGTNFQNINHPKYLKSKTMIFRMVILMYFYNYVFYVAEIKQPIKSLVKIHTTDYLSEFTNKLTNDKESDRKP